MTQGPPSTVIVQPQPHSLLTWVLLGIWAVGVLMGLYLGMLVSVDPESPHTVETPLVIPSIVFSGEFTLSMPTATVTETVVPSATVGWPTATIDITFDDCTLTPYPGTSCQMPEETPVVVASATEPVCGGPVTVEAGVWCTWPLATPTPSPMAKS